MNKLSGGYCSGVPPLPIPNREVKPACADGTAMQCGRVGGRHFFQSEEPFSRKIRGLFFLLFLQFFVPLQGDEETGYSICPFAVVGLLHY